MRYEVRIAGLGGQGVVLLGVVLAKAIDSNEKLHVVQTQSYGPESRGGAVRADLVVSSERVDYPKVRKPDVLVAMSQSAFDTYFETIKENGIAVIDSGSVTPEASRSDIKLKAVNATKEAAAFGKVVLANMIMLGALVNLINLTSKDAVVCALGEAVPHENFTENVKALEAGMKLSG